jgi:cytochrome c553
MILRERLSVLEEEDMRQRYWRSKLAWIGVSGVTWLAAGSVQAQEAHVLSNGQRIYSAYCEFCHGEKGKGDGPMVEHLQVQPTDLTQIQKKNAGQFPFWHVYCLPCSGLDMHQRPA